MVSKTDSSDEDGTGARQTFGLEAAPEFSGGGVEEEEELEALRLFRTIMENIKKMILQKRIKLVLENGLFFAYLESPLIGLAWRSNVPANPAVTEALTPV
jgi:hypothetical protein